MTKPIAVITNNYNHAFCWIRDQFPIQHYDQMKNKVTTMDGKVYILIKDKWDAAGWEFSSILMSPDYEDLIRYVRTRVR